MKHVFLLIMCLSLFVACTNEIPAEKKSEPAVVKAEPQPAEFADPKYAEIGKKMVEAFSKGDIDTWMTGYADNAVYQWNNGDSLAGKPAIDDYWRKRRMVTLDTISFNNLILLPIRVNQPQSIEAPGVWLLSWYEINAVYSNGNKVIQWIHTDYHFDANEKIDRVVQYVDRAPINAALAN